MDSRDHPEIYSRRNDLNSNSHSLEEINRFLFDWLAEAEITYAQVWGYHVSLSLFDLRLSKKGTDSNLHLVCGSSNFIQASTAWQDPTLRVVALNEGIARLSLQDAVAGFRVDCDLVLLARDVPPLFRR